MLVLVTVAIAVVVSVPEITAVTTAVAVLVTTFVTVLVPIIVPVVTVVPVCVLVTVSVSVTVTVRESSLPLEWQAPVTATRPSKKKDSAGICCFTLALRTAENVVLVRVLEEIGWSGHDLRECRIHRLRVTPYRPPTVLPNYPQLDEFNICIPNTHMW